MNATAVAVYQDPNGDWIIEHPPQCNVGERGRSHGWTSSSMLNRAPDILTLATLRCPR